MSSWSDVRPRILRGTEVSSRALPPADIGTVRSPAAIGLVVDPHLVEEALAEGYRAGYEEGMRIGLEQAAAAAHDREQARRSELQSVLQRLMAAADELRQRDAISLQTLEHEVVRGAFVLAEALVGHELAHCEAAGRDAFARTLELAPQYGNVTAFLHPDDIASAGDLATLVPGRALLVVGDASLARGDCVVEVGPTRIDARVSAALDRIQEVLQ